MAVLQDVEAIHKKCAKILALARAAQLASVMLDPGDQEGETVVTIPNGIKTQVKDRAIPILQEIKALAAGLPVNLP